MPYCSAFQLIDRNLSPLHMKISYNDEDVKYFEEQPPFVFSQLSKFVDSMREITKIEGKGLGGKGKKTKKVAPKKEGYIKNMMKKKEMV